MRESLRKLMDELGVGYELSAYETCPWAAFDDEKGLSVSAEVRMNNDGDEVEAEMQLMRDNPADGEQPVEQIFWLFAKPATADKWDVKDIKIRGEGNKENQYGWTEKAVAFFRACVLELKMGKIPDFDEILAREMKNNERFGGAAQGGGSKAPKIRPQQVMGMKGNGGI